MMNSNMSLIFKYCLSNTYLRLIIVNIAVICWAFHYYLNINWEPLRVPEYWTFQIVPGIYEVMVITILVNITIVIRQICKKRNIIHSVWDNFIRHLYYILSCFEISMGLAYIHFSTAGGIVTIGNLLFGTLIIIFGESTIVNTLTEENVYITLCAIFLLTVLVDTFTSFSDSSNRFKLSNDEDNSHADGS